jgi:hypothetical protein
MTRNVNSRPNLMKMDANTRYIAVYVKHMADELAALAEYAGSDRLSCLFTLASIEAENSPPISPLAKNPTSRSNKRSNNRRPPLVLLATSKAAQVISGMEAVHRIAKGVKEDTGTTATPGNVVRMRIVADSASGKK